MKFIQMTSLYVALALAACAGNSGKKNSDTAAKRDSIAAQERCPPGTLYDQFTRQCVEQEQARRRTPARDTLGRDMGGLPELSLPAAGGFLGR